MNFINDRPIYIQLVEQLEIYIISGKLSVGQRLPSVREFALQFQVNPNTIQKALLELEDKKLIYTERTNGKYVTNDQKIIDKFKILFAEEKITNYFNDMESIGFSKKEAISYLQQLGGKK